MLPCQLESSCHGPAGCGQGYVRTEDSLNPHAGKFSAEKSTHSSIRATGAQLHSVNGQAHLRLGRLHTACIVCICKAQVTSSIGMKKHRTPASHCIMGCFLSTKDVSHMIDWDKPANRLACSFGHIVNFSDVLLIPLAGSSLMLLSPPEEARRPQGGRQQLQVGACGYLAKFQDLFLQKHRKLHVMLYLNLACSKLSLHVRYHGVLPLIGGFVSQALQPYRRSQNNVCISYHTS